MRFYSPSTAGFYSSDLHKKAIPADAVEITADQHQALLSGMAAGQQIVISDGVVKLIEAEPDLSTPERAWRDGELVAVTWLRDRHRDELDMQLATTLPDDQFAELLSYIQALRDWPASEHFPAAEERPQPPAWLTRQDQ